MEANIDMKRDIITYLLKWKNSPNRKPLILEGARQVGKTWSVKKFANDHYTDLAYINFEEEKTLRSLFQQDFDTERLLRVIRTSTGSPCNPGKTLIFLDEIQEAEGGLTALKYFCERQHDQHIIVAGSLLGIELHRGSSFPVGKVNWLKMYPMTFNEYLMAMNQQSLVEAIENKDWQLIEMFHEKLIDWIKNYFIVGGMPECVARFANGGVLAEVRKIQNEILADYERDFSKHAPVELVPRIEQVWHSLPRQLARENNKFLFGLVKEGARAREYELALKWLQDSGLIYQIFNVTAPRLPLKSYSDNKAFKVYMHDVGLLGALSELDPKTVLDGSKIFVEFKGALTEQYVLQELQLKYNPYYWSKPKSTQEVDFLLQIGSDIVPIEAKAQENLQAKSLTTFMQQQSIFHAYKASAKPYKENPNITNLPLYAISTI